MVEKAGGPGSFLEVWVRCEVEECIRRDVKGMYAKALKGEIQQFTGVSDPYEEPLDAEIVVDTNAEPPALSVQRILSAMNQPAL
jgi:adenylylsulfate kinase